mmetsp:Transcript_29683/g.84936  ORF Transcript_29683/g.84936 Transcript_29683/m.84936 type:complete len:200 (-) Transcript_29683:140-739(-)
MISKSTQPKAHWSVFRPYGLPCSISGLMKAKVPTRVLLKSSVFSRWQATPKSASRTRPLWVSNTFCGFKSLCKNFRECRCWRPQHSCANQERACGSSTRAPSAALRIHSCLRSFSQRLMTKQRRSSDGSDGEERMRKFSRYGTMQGCRSADKSLTSRSASSLLTSFTQGSCLITRGRPMLSRASYTRPWEPPPRQRMTV